MTRGQRSAHLTVWLVLAPLLLMLIAFAVINRADASADWTKTAPPGEAAR